MKRGDRLSVEVTVTNVGARDGAETVHWFISDPYCSITRPVKELKSFRKVELKPGEEKKVEFVITEKDLRFWNDKKQFISEPGKFHLFIGTDSENVKKAEFVLL